MSRRDVPKIFTVLILLVLVGCSTNTDLGGTAVPNSRPDTRVTGQPPTLLEAGFMVEFNWTGTDPDGRIAGFQWKISNNGLDGISPRDTLTVDPLTGAEINPWFFTTVTDTTFIVLADVGEFPGDPAGFERSYRTHSLFIRAVDDKGAVDPSPAQVSFTSTTIVPTCLAQFANIETTQRVVFSVPPTVNFSYSGEDQDFDAGVPTHVRFLWTASSVERPDGTTLVVETKTNYDAYVDQLIDFDDPEWTEWDEYGGSDEERVVTYSDRPNEGIFLFAVQVRDTAGAYSIGRTYSTEVLNVRISAGSFSPGLEITEDFLGEYSSSISFNIASGQPLNFSWVADASSYSGRIESMRHGWDLADIEDANDPGWAVPPGTAEQNGFAEERIFSEGNHTFTVIVKDDSGAQRVLRWSISIIPFVSRPHQRNLVFVDQIVDNYSNIWPNPSGSIFYDNEIFRNEFWQFLADSAGVNGFTWERDFFDHTESRFDYEKLVGYKAALISARIHVQQAMFTQFRTEGTLDKFVWLTPYQKFGGNVFLVGNQSMESFFEVRSYMVPIVFDSIVEFYELNDVSYVVGFGTKELNDGTEVLRGTLMYPFATVGISTLDWNVPLSKNIYGRRQNATEDRTSKCSGLKEIRLVDAFRSNHLVGPGAIADFIGTNPSIDWRDTISVAHLNTVLRTDFPFSGDEFINDMIVERPSSLVLQECADGFEGLCIEPMFTGVTRVDWLREQFEEIDIDGWPTNSYTDQELREICGSMGLKSYENDEGTVFSLSSARANGKVYGYLSYKTVVDKPGNKADVYWGFDPYRFEPQGSKKAVLWVLQHFGLQLEAGGSATR